MARRKGKTGPFSGANTGPDSNLSSANASTTKAVGRTAPGRPNKVHRRGHGKKHRG
jgi:hypothetical protein